jgi:hypothetical protein
MTKNLLGINAYLISSQNNFLVLLLILYQRLAKITLSHLEFLRIKPI